MYLKNDRLDRGNLEKSKFIGTIGQKRRSVRETDLFTLLKGIYDFDCCYTKIQKSLHLGKYYMMYFIDIKHVAFSHTVDDYMFLKII